MVGAGLLVIVVDIFCSIFNGGGGGGEDSKGSETSGGK